MPSLRSGLAAATTLLLVAGTAAVIAPTAAHAATGCRTGADDFDGNGGTDVAIGAPRVGGNQDDGPYRGQVDVEMAYPSGTKTVHIAPPNDRVREFGKAIAEIDLSDHSDASTPCSALAISGGVVTDPQDASSAGTGVVFLYKWNAGKFTLVNTIEPSDAGTGLSDIGNALAAPTMATNSPAPRQPVLYAQVQGSAYPDNAVARLTLTPQGTVADHETIAPGKTATSAMPLTSAAASDAFGSTLLGVPDPDEVIIGDFAATIKGHGGAGAVVVWNDGGRSQLLTESTPGVPGGPERYDSFGQSVWLGTEVANDAHSPTSLFIGAPGESIGKVPDAGAAYQFTWNRSASPPAASTAAVKFWSQDSKGVAGTSENGDEFGSSFQSYTSHGGPPRYLVGVPGETYKSSGTGVVDVLGDNRSWDETVAGGRTPIEDYRFGTTLSARRNINDKLTNDPFPSPALGRWSADILVGSLYDTVTAGLPGGTVRTPGRFVFPPVCSGIPCDFGAAGITASGGG